MDLIENIENQCSNYKRGLITYTEMLQSIIKIASDELPRMIEYRKGSKGAWKVFSDKQYTQEEADQALEVLSYNSLGYTFRIVIAK